MDDQAHHRSSWLIVAMALAMFVLAGSMVLGAAVSVVATRKPR